MRSPTYPSMRMHADEQAEFVGQHLGPALARAGLATKIVIWDHNWNDPRYPIAVLNDPGAKRYVAGTAFHGYSFPPRPEAQSLVRAAHPDRDIYFTECTGLIGSDFAFDLRWMMRYLLIGATRHGARAVLLWNLALDEHGKPQHRRLGPMPRRGDGDCQGRGRAERRVLCAGTRQPVRRAGRAPDRGDQYKRANRDGRLSKSGRHDGAYRAESMALSDHTFSRAMREASSSPIR